MIDEKKKLVYKMYIYVPFFLLKGLLDNAQSLLRNGGSVSATDASRKTPLHYAAENGIAINRLNLRPL